MSKKVDEILDDQESFNELVNNMFNTIDTDRSGQINSNEFYNALVDLFEEMGLKRPSKDHTDKLLKEIDTDCSGKINKEEFAKFVKVLMEDS